MTTENAKPAPTPMETSSKSSAVDEIGIAEAPSAEVPYRPAIGSLMYLMVGTRPDLSDAVGKLSSFCENPLKHHWTAVKRMLRYVAGTRDQGILFGKDTSLTPIGYSDSDWAGCRETRKSTSGYIFLLAGGAISWRSKKQTVLATSSCEAEYIASCSAAKEAVWLSRLIADIHGLAKFPKMLIFSDSAGAIASGRNVAINQRNKHIDIQYHYVRDVVAAGKVEFKWCPTESMVADALTKPLDRVKVSSFAIQMGLCPLELYGTSIKGECWKCICLEFVSQSIS